MAAGPSESESEFDDLAAGYLRCARSLRETHDPDGIV